MSKPIFIVLEGDSGGYNIYTHQSSHYHSIRTDLSKIHAENLTRELNKLATVKLTNPDCPHCVGVGGCHWCEFTGV